jgi:transposase
VRTPRRRPSSRHTSCSTTPPRARRRRSSAGSSATRFTFHFTLTYSSWLNLVERRFAELTTKWIKRSAHRSVRDLVASIRTWITLWNDNPKPFVWHKSADEILDSIASYCQRNL